jgi:predicted dehydrogenase
MLKVTDRRQLFRSVPAPRGGQYEEVPVERRDTTAIELERFVRCIREDGPEPVTVEWARRVVAAMTACEESSRTGREVILAD